MWRERELWTCIANVMFLLFCKYIAYFLRRVLFIELCDIVSVANLAAREKFLCVVRGSQAPEENIWMVLKCLLKE